MRTLIPADLSIDFVGMWKPWALASGLSVLAALVAIPVFGVRLGIDFVGGIETQIRVGGDAPVDEGNVRQALAKADLEETSVFRMGGVEDRTFVVRVGGEESSELDKLAPRIESLLAAELGEVTTERTDVVGPRAGAEFREKAWLAVLFSVLGIGIYMALRFDPRYVPGALAALVHDAVLSASAVIVFGFPIDFTVIAAVLTVIGYSLNDTIVIYDRIRENIGLRTTAEIERLVNDSLNETLSRTVLTAGTVLITSLALLVFGGEALRGFSLAITVGVVVGTYSTIFIATPSLLYLGKRHAAVVPSVPRTPRSNQPDRVHGH